MRNRLRAARKAAGYTQEEMAEAIGTSIANYGLIERGDRNGNFRIWDAQEIAGRLRAEQDRTFA